METKQPTIIHIASIRQRDGAHYLLLRQLGHEYVWFKEQKPGQEIRTEVAAPSVEEAIRLARRFWKQDAFRTINCGFRYSLPERDEHGQNALFKQMLSSYSSMNGIYFDEDLSYNCIVHQASNEARQLGARLFPY